MDGEDTSKKSHRERLAGRKAEKKAKKTKQNDENLTDKQRNPKAFAINSAVSAERRFRRRQDMETKKQHIPLVDRNPIEPPPVLVAIVGPPKVGKSTLISNLIKLFTRSPLVEIKGPVTIVTGKKRRITFIECNNDINSMIDLAKVADLVLLLCDASFGFEMEVFEFLNICQVHGMPKIMGVLTHLDMIKNAKTLKNTKKVLKHRFWTEVYPGAKLFYLSGIIREEYLKNELRNLGRFISVMKFRPLTWRTSHSYLLGDRYEDLTNSEIIRDNPKCDRNVCLYGYVRGLPIKKNGSVHVAGLGDLKIHDISFLPDPCSLPDKTKKRALVDRERLIYAPFSGVGGIVYDKDAVYIEMGNKKNQEKRDDDENITSNLVDTIETVDAKRNRMQLQIFSEGKDWTMKDLDDNDGSSEDEDVNEDDGEEDEDEEEVAEESEENNEEEKNDDEDDDKEGHGEEEASESEKEEKEVKAETSVAFKAKTPVSDELEAEMELVRELEELKKVPKASQENAKSEASSDEEDDDEEQEEEEDDDEESEDENVMPKLKQYKEEKVEVNGRSRRRVIFDENDFEVTSKRKGEDALHSKVHDLLTKLEKRPLSSVDKEESEDGDDEEELQGSEDKTMEESEDQGSEDNMMEDDEDDEDEDDEDEDDDLTKWKENLAEKARSAFFERQSSSQNLMKLVYAVYDAETQINKADEDEKAKQEEEKDEEIADLFFRVSRTQQKQTLAKDTMNLVDTSLMQCWSTPIAVDWIEDDNKCLIVDCFVTGKWNEAEDANELLRLDDAASDTSEVFGDFEDLETGDKFTASENPSSETDGKKKRKLKEDDEDIEAERNALAEKKRKLKEKFDSEYDNGEEKNTYYDDLKSAAEKQAQLNKSVFEDMPDVVRVQFEGCRPGMYVRIELRGVPCEFVDNFDPTYPLVVGALNMEEVNIGYVNVRFKKHRWYSKILKTGDPIIVSMGWRRFQTLPIYTKLEDDLKFRYLKYTPEHLSCNAHFWGPITPQGTGVLALQSVEANPEILNRQGFRIAATGTVQELDKSTRIMKKLKLIGYPLKIFKKTAFIKDMFSSSLEAARFEGARLMTTSKVRGQIKKAVNKPEGCFRATFEDKILLSDIVFLRTWYKVDVQEYYNPVTSLLLPHDQKNSWKGVRTTGEIKRERNIRNQPNQDSLYTPIERQVKPFKPLIIPAKLQRALPYKDKPKNSVKFSEKKKKLDRVAVIREPHEQKVATLMKRVKMAFEHKQEKLKQETKERLEKHRREVEARESFKDKKLKQKKKEVFRRRSKAQNKSK